MNIPNPSDLTEVQQAAVLSVLDTGGERYVISSLYQTRTIRALHRRYLVKRVTLRFAEGEREWWALTANGQILREVMQERNENRRRNRR